MSRVLLVIAAVALVSVAPGCGTSGDQLSKDEYQQELDQASKDLTQASEGLGTELSNAIQGDGSYEQAAEEMGAVREQLDETADDLDSVSPPEDTAAAHDRLVDALHGYSDDLGELQDVLANGKDAEIVRKLQSIESLESVRDLQRAGADLRALAYKFAT